MSNKLFLDNKDYDAPYEPSASEDEYSEEEKQILKEVRQGNRRKVDPKQEVLAFDDSPDEDDEDNDIIGDSDIERGDEDDGIPDSKAWGKQRRSYYNTDFVDQDYSAYNEQEEEQAQQEEEEAKTIQLRLAKQLDEADFFLDAPTGGADSDDDHAEDKSKKLEAKIKLKSDLTNLTQRQKQQLFKKDSPEFAGLVNDFETLLSESELLLDPIMEFAEENDLQLPIIDFVRTRDDMIMTYCTNVAFYLLLKANRIPIKYHPITKRLAQLKQLLGQLQETFDDVVKPQLEDLLERINSGEEVNIATKSLVEAKPSKKLRMMKAFNEENGETSDEEYEDEPMGKRAKLSDEEGASTDQEEDAQEDDENYEAERRGITYQIAKNKGLMPHRKKESRNPRVKHRGKFRKALIRRKGAVRTVRKETTRYGGEVSGIKATVKKGIKIKS